MADPTLDPREHVRALVALARLNAVSCTARRLWKSISAAAGQAGAGALRILDVACGGGDVTVSLWRLARKDRMSVRIEGVDLSPVAVEFATARARRRGAAVAFRQGNFLEGDLSRDYDVVTCSLFLHELEPGSALTLLERMSRAARLLVLVDDLERSFACYVLVLAGAFALTRSPVVHTDARRSVRAAFRPREARELAEVAGLGNVRVERHWPLRYLLRGSPA